MKPLTQEELAPAVCAVGGEAADVLWLHGACHPSAGHRVSYHKRTGHLVVDCRKCRALVAVVLVARKEDSP